MTTQQRYEAASKAVRDAEARGMSASTLARRYRELFAAEDAAKAAGCL